MCSDVITVSSSSSMSQRETRSTNKARAAARDKLTAVTLTGRFFLSFSRFSLHAHSLFIYISIHVVAKMLLKRLQFTVISQYSLSRLFLTLLVLEALEAMELPSCKEVRSLYILITSQKVMFFFTTGFLTVSMNDS